MPPGRGETEIRDMAANAYRVAEGQKRTEDKIEDELAQREELVRTAWLSVTIGQAERAFVDQRLAEWKMRPDFETLTQD